MKIENANVAKVVAAQKGCRELRERGDNNNKRIPCVAAL